MKELLKGTLYYATDRYPVEVEVKSKARAVAYYIDLETGKRTGMTKNLVWNKYINQWSSSGHKIWWNRGCDFYEGEQEYYYDPSF